MHHTGRLRDAADLAKDYILAVLGHGKEHFNFKCSMVPTGEPFSTPIYKIAVLLEELRIVNAEKPDKPLEKVILYFVCICAILFCFIGVCDGQRVVREIPRNGG